MSQRPALSRGSSRPTLLPVAIKDMQVDITDLAPDAAMPVISLRRTARSLLQSQQSGVTLVIAPLETVKRVWPVLSPVLSPLLGPSKSCSDSWPWNGTHSYR
jgi:hypothetical protein